MDLLPSVVVFDADPAIRATICELFAEDGYSVRGAGTVEEALAQLAECADGSVVIFDNMLPHYGNGEFFRTVAADPALVRRFCFVCVTTHPGLIAPDVFRLLVALRVPVLQKPFDIDLLEGSVAEAQRRFARQAAGRLEDDEEETAREETAGE